MITISSSKTEHHSDKKELRTFFRAPGARYGSVMFISNLWSLVVDPMMLNGCCGYHASRFNKLLALDCWFRTRAAANRFDFFDKKTQKGLDMVSHISDIRIRTYVSSDISTFKRTAQISRVQKRKRY
jgi:hypothetical protein